LIPRRTTTYLYGMALFVYELPFWQFSDALAYARATGNSQRSSLPEFNQFSRPIHLFVPRYCVSRSVVEHDDEKLAVTLNPCDGSIHQ
jgi:hypothetical protein